MPSSTSNFDFRRVIPDLPWRRLALTAALLTAVAAVAWEVRARRLGYAPTHNDTSDFWAQERRKVQPDSIVVIGDSRAIFDVDLDALEQSLGKRPVQLALPGTCAYPILADLVADEKFHGTVIASLLPALWLAPEGSPIDESLAALKRFRTQTAAQRASHELALLLEQNLACLKQEDLTLKQLLKRIEIKNRPGALVAPKLPPYFQTTDRDRRMRMAEACAKPGPLQDRVKFGWLELFQPPPPPSWIPKEEFMKAVGLAVEQRFKDTAATVKKLQARGGKVIFVRFPHTGEVKKIEDQATPRAGPWDRIIRESGAPGIYYSDYPELSGFDCPEWSHLSAADSVEFTKRLAPHLQRAMAAGR
ncbi:MAG: hypothetical protein HY302_00075 [Opitutae bacterium]|nr:hypothetical protein [Opitutae bacterium]